MATVARATAVRTNANIVTVEINEDEAVLELLQDPWVFRIPCSSSFPFYASLELAESAIEYALQNSSTVKQSRLVSVPGVVSTHQPSISDLQYRSESYRLYMRKYVDRFPKCGSNYVLACSRDVYGQVSLAVEGEF